ncbi:MAG: TIGR02147 family protein [Bdellovibrionales bacterium]
MKSVFEFSEYKAYLVEKLSAGKVRSGLRAKLAQHLGCQTAYISQVLGGHQHLSPEQAFRTNSFLGHDKEESHFFHLLVQHNRAGTKELESYYLEQMNDIRARRSLIKNRVNADSEIPAEFQSRYFSSWQYTALTVALTVPELQTKEALAQYFRLPLQEIAKALQFLIEIGMAEQRGDRYYVGPRTIHLGNEADNIHKHHTNWRLQALDSLHRASVNPHDLHYSVVFSLSRTDMEKFRERFLELIKTNIKDVAPSKEELIFVTCIDFFEARR